MNKTATIWPLAVGTALLLTGNAPAKLAIDLATLPRLATVDERYQSYNVEMVEVTGGRFWAPYGGPADERYRQRPALDLSNRKLRNLAKHLSPALMRVSGTWANNTYVPADGETPATPPDGFKQVLTRQQWRGVVDFSKAVDAPLVTSFPVSSGARDASGAWTPAQASRLLALTHAFGGSVYAAEFFNEPNLPSGAGGLPSGYGAEMYARDFRVFRQWLRKESPRTLILGTGAIGEGVIGKGTRNLDANAMSSANMMKANPGTLDAVSYHFYGSLSQRCKGQGMGTADKGEALSAAWLDRTLIDHKFYAALRDTYEPGKPLWVTETAQAACGGSPWASTFLDTFRYVNQLGVLAQKGVQVVMHNTLAASDYALIDQDTLDPRPSYWAAVLWRQTMGRTVLASPVAAPAHVRLYAHCLRGRRGGVALLALNTGTSAEVIPLGKRSQAWIVTSDPVDGRNAKVNGHRPGMDDRGRLQGLSPASNDGDVRLPALSIAFVAVANAGNLACR